MINVVKEVGGVFRARCPGCGETAHHGPARTARNPDRVRCSKCGRVFRATRIEEDTPQGDSPVPPATSPPPLHRRRVPDGVEQQWHDRVAARGPEGAVAYRADALLEVGQLVDHPVFGLGAVRKLIPPTTAEVHFQQGFKRLRCRL